VRENTMSRGKRKQIQEGKKREDKGKKGGKKRK